MKKSGIRFSVPEIDLRNMKMTLLIMVGVPVLLSLALVATALVFGRPLDSAQVLADGSAQSSVHLIGEGSEAAEKDALNVSVVEPVRHLPTAPASDDGYEISELYTSPERALVLGLFGSYANW